MVRLQAIVPSLKRRLQKLLGPSVELIWIPCPQIDVLAGDLAKVEDVIFDMGVRATAAMPFGGRLVVETANIDLDDATAAVQQLKAGPHVMMEMTCLRQAGPSSSFTDAVARIERIPGAWIEFDFSRAYSAIRALGGQICEYNEPGRALTIRAFFVSEIEISTCVQDLPVSNDELKQQLRILLVEDEGYVRDVACEILESEGYQVFTARTGKEALEVFENNGPVELLLTDVIMPGMNGHELAAQLSSVNPNLKTIYMSGYTDHFGTKIQPANPGLTFLQKPFTLESLTTKVKQVLDSDAV